MELCLSEDVGVVKMYEEVALCADMLFKCEWSVEVVSELVVDEEVMCKEVMFIEMFDLLWVLRG